MEFAELVSTRRSVHEYSDQAIEESTLEAIIETAALSPSGYNLQPWEFLALRDDAQKDALAEIAYGQDHVSAADTALVVLGNTDPMAHAETVFDDWLAAGYIPNEEVREALLENVEGMAALDEPERRVWSTRSTALAAMTVMYAAWDRGVASCPMEGFDPDALVERFDIPTGYEPVMLITLGYPAEGAADIDTRRKGRRPIDDILHYGEFDPAETSLDQPTVSDN